MKRKFGLLALVALGVLSFQVGNAQEPNKYSNLQVLDADTTRDELGDAMLQNLFGLGLPRRQREGCLFCHVGDMDLPVSEWDFPSDDKKTKLKARVMMQMVADINADYLARLDDRMDPDFRVTCETCHAGRTDPRPLDTILIKEYSANGISGAIDKYEELRARYFGAGAYDFRPYVLTKIARTIAATGAWNDALVIETKNEEVHPDNRSAARARLTMQVARKMYEDSVLSALAYYDEIRQDEAPGVAGYSILDNLGWTIHREERVDDALLIFRKNLELFPSEYVANESLGDALWFSDDKAAGIAVFEAWVQANPENDMGRRRLLNMQEEFSKTE